MASLDAVITPQIINLGAGTGVASPRLSWWHQVSLMDGRYVNCPVSRSGDQGVVQYHVYDFAGDPTGVWINLQPFANTYDTQAMDNYRECMFDPVDDGNTEDDYFVPTDPNRDLGPSSTCHPEFSYSCVGDTNDPFQVENVCNAQIEPPSDEPGALGIGTWVKSEVDLSGLRGRRIKLRMLVTGIKATAETHAEQFPNANPGPWDDGWWMDDITIDETLSSPATLSLDTKSVGHCTGDDTVGCLTAVDCSDAGTTGPCLPGAPQCGEICETLTVQCETEPNVSPDWQSETLAAPGQSIEIDCSTSSGVCLDGALQFRFTGDGGATVYAPWSENPVLIVALFANAQIDVEVRCSTDPNPDRSCNASASVDVEVDCPSSGTVGGGAFGTVSAEGGTKAVGDVTFTWSGSVDFEVHKGDLPMTSAYLGVQATGSGSAYTDTEVPGVGFYYIFREWSAYCNARGSWNPETPHDGLFGVDPWRDAVLPFP
jgi:hypothetical protein